jgi:hypothetical protein
MKKIFFSLILGLALMTLTGCYESKSGATAQTKKCQSGKCGDDKKAETQKTETPAKKCQAGKCGNK